MMVKFLAHGKGSATNAAAYLLAAHDHMGVVRAGVKTLRGNGEIFSALADSSGFSQRYTSGVIAWAPSDAPTDDELEQVLDSFENLAFAGLDKRNYHFFAVLHEEDDGSRHIHVMAPRIHLGTKKSLNIAPPGHTRAFYAWRDLWNERMGWASPADPLRRRRVVVPPHEVRANRAKISQGLQLERDPRDFIADSIEAAVYAGKIKNRADVETFLKNDFFEDEENGRVSRVVRNSISVQLRREDGELEKPMRLTGVFFDHDFDADDWLGNEQLLRVGALEAPREPNADLLAELTKEVENYTEKRAAYNKKRYIPKTPKLSKETKTKPTINLKVIYDGAKDGAGESRKTRDRAAKIREYIGRTNDRIQALRASINRAERRVDALRESIRGEDERIEELRRSVKDQQQEIIVVTGSIEQYKKEEQQQLAATKTAYERDKVAILHHAQTEIFAAQANEQPAIRCDLTGFVRWAVFLHEGVELKRDDPVLQRFMAEYGAYLHAESDRQQGRYMRQQKAWTPQDRAKWLIEAQTYRFDFDADIAERTQQRYGYSDYDAPIG